jgi:hypothetical protein
MNLVGSRNISGSRRIKYVDVLTNVCGILDMASVLEGRIDIGTNPGRDLPLLIL